MIKIVDTFVDFKQCFKNNLDLSIDEKIALWENCYMSKYPELEKKCKQDYELAGYNWLDIARDMIFNRTKNDFNIMLEAYDNLLNILDEVNIRVKEVFAIEPDLSIILYCGLGNSAGWVDTYEGKRAILYGIDKIAELKWHTKEKLEALIAHELCHVVHSEIRGQADIAEYIEKSKFNEGIWGIYQEGFAQFFQQKLLKEEGDSRGIEWLEKCTNCENDLKQLYKKSLSDAEKGTSMFFGDWFKVLGISDTGYYLGAKLVEELYEKYSIKEIACLTFARIEKEVISFLNT